MPMETAQLAKLLTAVQEGRLSVAEAVAQWPGQAGGAPDFAVLDHGRAARTGMPEVVFCQGKTADQVVAIVGRLLTNEGRALATRASVETARSCPGRLSAGALASGGARHRSGK